LWQPHASDGEVHFETLSRSGRLGQRELEQKRLQIAREGRPVEIFMQIGFEIVMTRHDLLVAGFSFFAIERVDQEGKVEGMSHYGSDLRNILRERSRVFG
jgi:hypothetical protein